MFLGPVPRSAPASTDERDDPEPETDTREVSSDVAAKVLSRAAETQVRAADRIRAEDLFAAGAEAGIPADVVARALKEHDAEERAARKQRARAELKRRRRSWERKETLKRVGSYGLRAFAVVCALVLTVWGGYGLFLHSERETLTAQMGLVRAERAHVHTAAQRQDEVLARWSREPASSERTAEIAGAGNRLYVAIHRYDEAVTAYNMHAIQSGGYWVRLLKMPPALPISTEVRTW